jgi:mannose-6-phosphate isomerase
MLPHYYKENRPWGLFERFTLNEASTVKIITVNAGEAFSRQTHTERTEFWKIISGSGKASVGSEMHDAKVGDTFLIPPKTEHRMEGGPEGITFLEISFGHFDENDIIRTEDKYGRT